LAISTAHRWSGGTLSGGRFSPSSCNQGAHTCFLTAQTTCLTTSRLPWRVTIELNRAPPEQSERKPLGKRVLDAFYVKLFLSVC
jgi:hypothetical protein